MAYNEFAYFYDELNSEADYDALYRYVTDELAAHGIRDGILADLGCGTGDLTLMLAQAGYDVIGIDRSEEMLSVLREKADDFIFDLNTPYKHQKILAGETFDIEAEDAECHWTNHFDAATGRVDITIDIDYHETGEHFKESFSEYSYPLDLVTSLLEKYGFTVAKVADGEDFGLVRPDSPRWIITAVKQYTQEGERINGTES